MRGRLSRDAAPPTGLARLQDITSDGSRRAWGLGLATHVVAGLAEGERARVLDVWFPEPHLGDDYDDQQPTPADLRTLESRDDDRGTQTGCVAVSIHLDRPPAHVVDAYLRLHLLSHRLVRPNTINLDGIFAVLPNVVWTNYGPCAVEGFEQTRLRLRRRGPVEVRSVDKFPRMTDYVLPTGVRIADADRVRLGAHLAEGTTVMHEGFCNYNAGTLGTSMVEGRIVQGVVVDDGSDIGGGASIMGTLSGGGTERVRVGKRCLLGAQSGLGIALGDDCVVEAGLYLTAGTKVTLPDGSVVKARELSGRDNLLFLRNSVTGTVEARDRSGSGIRLNDVLHANL